MKPAARVFVRNIINDAMTLLGRGDDKVACHRIFNAVMLANPLDDEDLLEALEAAFVGEDPLGTPLNYPHVPVGLTH